MLKRLLAIVSMIVVTASSFAESNIEAATSDVVGPTEGRFVSAEKQRTTNPQLFGEFSAKGSTGDSGRLAAVAPGWSSTVTTNLRISYWNTFVYTPYIQNKGTPVSGTISNLIWSTNVSYYSSAWMYPIETYVLVYDAAGTYIGYVSAGYIQAAYTSRTISLVGAGLPMTSKFVYAYRVNGGSSATITNPPTITSASASVN